MEPGEFAFRTRFDPVSGETEYEECLILQYNTDTDRAKVAFESNNGYGDIETHVPGDKLAEERAEE